MTNLNTSMEQHNNLVGGKAEVTSAPLRDVFEDAEEYLTFVQVLMRDTYVLPEMVRRSCCRASPPAPPPSPPS